MARKKIIQPGEKLGLKLTEAQRSLLLEALPLIPKEIERAIRSTPAREPLMFTLDDLDDLAGHVAAGANHAQDKASRGKLERISRKIRTLLWSVTDQPKPTAVEEEPSRHIEILIDMITGAGPTTLPPPSRSGKGEELYPLKLTDKQREALIHATRLRRGIKNKLQQVPEGTQVVGLTRKELDETASEVDLAVQFAPNPSYRKRLEAVMVKLEDLLDALGDEPSRSGRKGKPAKKADLIYQLKITLKDTKPPVWRRIQVADGSLGDLHEVIQVVMGWQDAHMHQFIVGGTYYGPNTPDDFGFGVDTEVEDERGILLSQVVKGGGKVRFVYEYDFGDGWRHEILFERAVEREAKAKYPRCVEGKRACPPEDCGGPWGYADFLAAIGDPKHEDHRDMKEWVGGKFDPEKFSAEVVNQRLKGMLR